MRVIGVDEHRWSHSSRQGGDGFVTVIIDLTAIDGIGRARLVDLVRGPRSIALLETTPARHRLPKAAACSGHLITGQPVLTPTTPLAHGESLDKPAKVGAR